LKKTSPIDPTVGYADPFAKDELLYTITAENAAQYKGLLSAGHQALLKRDARTFRMPVFPARRSAAYPDDVLTEVKKQAPLANSNTRASLGRLDFHVPGGITYGQHWLNVKFAQSVVRVPFRILTKEEDKLLDKHYKDIKKQMDDAFIKKN
jgi:hypothetical protein